MALMTPEMYDQKTVLMVVPTAVTAPIATSNAYSMRSCPDSSSRAECFSKKSTACCVMFVVLSGVRSLQRTKERAGETRSSSGQPLGVANQLRSGRRARGLKRRRDALEDVLHVRS